MCRTSSSTTTPTISAAMRRPRSSRDASYLVSHPEIKIVIGGYCDERGSNEYNLALGQNRADAAKNALVTAGVAANRIRVISYGKEKPFCTESTEECWQHNRRAGFTLDRRVAADAVPWVVGRWDLNAQLTGSWLSPVQRCSG